MSAQPLLRVNPDHAEPQHSGQASHGATAETRTPLSIIEYKPRKRLWSFIVLCLVIIGATVATALGINVKVAKGQYELVQLNKQQQQLAQDNQARTAELYNKKSPQNLAANAAKLGMTASGSAATIDIEKKKIYGTATEAKKKDKGAANGPHVKAPRAHDYNERELARAREAIRAKQNEAVTKQQNTSSSIGSAAVPGTDASGPSAAEKTSKANANVSDTPQQNNKAKDTAGNNKKTADAQKETKPFDGKDLNGGSIPGPQTTGETSGN
ncbi:hypothetical protein [Pseudoglutamicibacter cumminsii]|uniref:hypothetical protein n=1 Tax=Pseudoglutamicibacter cumminsii TaxID=156979 RepID=UPI00195ADFA1|nr:hypothetical protein [Pseudoglutamicibacter cumminsii]MBM7795145.1 hypothetical protein [Pseudoglutamicibacter cumminsii]